MRQKAVVLHADQRREHGVNMQSWGNLDKAKAAELVSRVISPGHDAPYLTADGYWLTEAKIEPFNWGENRPVVHVNIYSSFPEGSEVVGWHEGHGYQTYEVGDPHLMVRVLMEVLADPESCYSRARDEIIAAGGIPYKSHRIEGHGMFGGESEIQAVPSPWGERQMGMRPLGMSDADFYAFAIEYREKNSREDKVSALVDETTEAVREFFPKAVYWG